MNQRLRRLADQIQRELADLIRNNLKDPRLGGMVTISAVKVSSDLGYADLYVTVLGNELRDDMNEQAHKDSLDVLNGAAGFLRSELGRRIQTRTVPRLRFHYDTLTAQGNYLNDLIHKAVSSQPAVESPETAQPPLDSTMDAPTSSSK